MCVCQCMGQNVEIEDKERMPEDRVIAAQNMSTIESSCDLEIYVCKVRLFIYVQATCVLLLYLGKVRVA